MYLFITKNTNIHEKDRYLLVMIWQPQSRDQVTCYYWIFVSRLVSCFVVCDAVRV